jgi:hypothetical protein
MKKDLKQFDYKVIAKLDSDMWRAYYRHQFFKLFVLLFRLFHSQFASSWSVVLQLAYYSAWAAADYRIKKGNENHQRVLKNLVKFYKVISDNSTRSFDYTKAAELELEWWDIRRYPSKYNSTLQLSLAKNAAVVHGIEADQAKVYARYRAEAMLLRDEQGDVQRVEPDWPKIEGLLVKSWRSLYQEVNR